MIERGEGNRAAIERITTLKGNDRLETLGCSNDESAATGTSQAAPGLEGTFRTRFSEKELADSPLLVDAGEINDEAWGEHTLRLSNGRVRYTQRNARAHGGFSGRYTTHGDTIELTFEEIGETYAFRWSLFRGTLKFERYEALGVGPTPWLIKPWRRVR